MCAGGAALLGAAPNRGARPVGGEVCAGDGGAEAESESRCGQGWRGRGVALVAGRQNVATPAGSRVARK